MTSATVTAGSTVALFVPHLFIGLSEGKYEFTYKITISKGDDEKEFNLYDLDILTPLEIEIKPNQEPVIPPPPSPPLPPPPPPYRYYTWAYNAHAFHSMPDFRERESQAAVREAVNSEVEKQMYGLPPFRKYQLKPTSE